jgi:hypothetical protein
MRRCRGQQSRLILIGPQQMTPNIHKEEDITLVWSLSTTQKVLGVESYVRKDGCGAGGGMCGPTLILAFYKPMFHISTIQR